MVSVENIIKTFEEDGFRHIGTIGGIPYFIDNSSCPWAKTDIYKYDPLDEFGYSIDRLESVKDPIVKQAAEAGIYIRDTENAEYIADLHSFGERTYTEEKRKSRPGNPDGVRR